MTMGALERILPFLSDLTDIEVSKLRARLSAFASLGTPKMEASDEDLVLEALCEYLSSKGIEYAYPALLKKTPQYRSFSRKSDSILRFLQTKVKIEQRALLALGMDLLYKNLCDIGIAVSARTMMMHIHRMPACLNRSFPGYAANGMLAFIVRRGR